MSALHEILNDPGVMPNADCPDLVVTVNEVTFGKSVGTIYFAITGFHKYPERAASADERYKQASHAKGLGGAYDDLTDAVALRHNIAILEKALQKKLGLTYQPTLHCGGPLGRSDDW